MKANGGSVNYTYDYDRYGNRWHQNVTSGTGITMLLNFNGNNQVSSSSYDPLGNTMNDGSHTYTYDAENRPITVSGGTSYAYDAFGRRVYRQITAGVREYTFDLQGNVLTRIISGSIGPANISIAGRHWGDIPTSNGSTLFMHTDWLGSARAYTNLNGSAQATCQTLPFGDARSCTVNSDDDYYAGPLWWNGDDSSYLSQTRRYNPAQAHWTTTDPAGLAETAPADPQTLNRYAYVMNNPLGFIDPTGLACYQFELQNFHRCPVPVPAAGTNEFAILEAAFTPTALAYTVDPIAWYLIYGHIGLLNQINNPPPGPGSDPAVDSVSAAPPQQPPLKPGCTKAGLWAGLKAAGQDLIPVPPQFNPDPVGATGDLLTSKQGQAATIGVLYEVATGARYLAPFADAAADFVPVAGQIWLAYQVGHALYEGGVAYKEAIDQCYGGG